MNFDHIYFKSALPSSLIDELSEQICNCAFSVIDSSKNINIAGEDGEKMNNGKKVVFVSTSPNQVKHSPACNAGYCPGFRKIVIASNGCPFSCEYCFLQATYRNLHPYIKVNANIEDLLRELDRDLSTRREATIYNAGEMLDSLALDELTRISSKLVPFFAERENAYLLLLTKSDNVKGLSLVPHNGHTIVAWSINCKHITDHFEHGTANLERRVEAAAKCAEWGYPIRFRFDPLIIHDGWEQHYPDMVRFVLTKVKPQRITLGSLRFVSGVKSWAQKRFPNSPIFDHEFTGRLEDGKCRYLFTERLSLYRAVIEEIRKYNKTVEIGFCKESQDIWDAVGFAGRGRICNCLL